MEDVSTHLAHSSRAVDTRLDKSDKDMHMVDSITSLVVPQEDTASLLAPSHFQPTSLVSDTPDVGSHTYIVQKR